MKPRVAVGNGLRNNPRPPAMLSRTPGSSTACGLGSSFVPRFSHGVPALLNLAPPGSNGGTRRRGEPDDDNNMLVNMDPSPLLTIRRELRAHGELSFVEMMTRSRQEEPTNLCPPPPPPPPAAAALLCSASRGGRNRHPAAAWGTSSLPPISVDFLSLPACPGVDKKDAVAKGAKYNLKVINEEAKHYRRGGMRSSGVGQILRRPTSIIRPGFKRNKNGVRLDARAICGSFGVLSKEHEAVVRAKESIEEQRRPGRGASSAFTAAPLLQFK